MWNMEKARSGLNTSINIQNITTSIIRVVQQTRQLWWNANNSSISVNIRSDYALHSYTSTMHRWPELPWLHISNQKGGCPDVTRHMHSSTYREIPAIIYTKGLLSNRQHTEHVVNDAQLWVQNSPPQQALQKFLSPLTWGCFVDCAGCYNLQKLLPAKAETRRGRKFISHISTAGKICAISTQHRLSILCSSSLRACSSPAFLSFLFFMSLIYYIFGTFAFILLWL